jgi:hypothetical protein
VKSMCFKNGISPLYECRLAPRRDKGLSMDRLLCFAATRKRHETLGARFNQPGFYLSASLCLSIFSTFHHVVDIDSRNCTAKYWPWLVDVAHRRLRPDPIVHPLSDHSGILINGHGAKHYQNPSLLQTTSLLRTTSLLSNDASLPLIAADADIELPISRKSPLFSLEQR